MENIASESQCPLGEDQLPTQAERPTAGVRRVNNVPLLIIGGVLIVFVILVGAMITRRPADSAANSEHIQGALPESTRLLDRLLISGATAGIVQDVGAEATEPVLTIPMARVEEADLPPLPSMRIDPPPVPERVATDELDATRMSRLQSALASKTGVPISMLTTAGSADEMSRPAGDTQDSSSANVDKSPSPTAEKNPYALFDKKPGAKSDRWRLASSLEKSRSQYELRAGAVIPAVLISGIDSDLPGQILAQVSQDVFDTATGRHRLIPQGARLIGRYDRVAFGQSRLLVAWQRLVYPDGRSLDIGAMDGVDGAGYAGFTDKINRHYVRVFGSAIFLSGITAGLTSSGNDSQNDPYGTSNSTLLSQALAQQLGTVATEMLRKNIDVAPTLRIRPGYRFHVMAVKDMTFERAYMPFE